MPGMEKVLSTFFVVSFHTGRRHSLWGWELGVPGGNGSREGYVFKACGMSSALRRLSWPIL